MGRRRHRRRSSTKGVRFLFQWSDLDFARASEAGYGTFANPVGGAEWNWAASGVLRSLGDFAMLEDGITNEVLDSEDVTGTGWTNDVGIITADDAAAPDGEVDADRFAGDGSARDRFYALFTAATTGVATAWIKGIAGNAEAYLRVGAPNGGADLDITDSWDRYSQLPDASPNVVFQPEHINGGSESSFSSTEAIHVWGVQYDDHCVYPRSYVRTSGSAATKLADDLELAAGSVPEEFKTGRWGVKVRPFYSSAEAPAAATIFLLSNFYYLGFVGNIIRFRLNTSYQSSLTWSRHDEIEIQVDFSGTGKARVRVNGGAWTTIGATLGSNTFADAGSVPVAVGDSGALGGFDGLIGRPYEVPSW